MADFCHDYDPGGLGCGGEGDCPSDCIGDFTLVARSRARTMKPGYLFFMGICEGHGDYVFLVRQQDGSYIIEHRDMETGDLHSKKKWVPCDDA